MFSNNETNIGTCEDDTFKESDENEESDEESVESAVKEKVLKVQ